MKRALAWFSLGLLLPGAALAVSTRSFVVDTSDTFEKGKLEGVASHAGGKLTRGASTDRTPIEGVPVATRSTVGPDGAIYVATGNEGRVYRVAGGAAKVFADTDAALITSLEFAGDTLYAGSLPKGRVFAIDKNGKHKELAPLAGAEHVWALSYDAKRRVLYAATGPEGKLFAIDASGKASVVYDDAAEHLLCLGLDEQGRVYAGTSNGARVVRVTRTSASVLYDFAGQEVTALDVGPRFVAVAANEFTEAAPSTSGESKDGNARLKRPKPGKGKVHALGFDGRVQELYASEASHVSALEVERASSAVHIGLAQDGRIVRATESGERAQWADADERSVVSIALESSAPHFLTSDGVSVYHVRDPKKDGTWTSAVLDAKVPARFGELSLRARGKVRWATRSGNTEVPDASWTAWSNESGAAGPIKSPGARFLQARVTLTGDAELYALTAYYLPDNLPARVRNVRVRNAKSGEAKGATSSKGISLGWDVDNPDEDKLRYRLFYRSDEYGTFLPMLREHELLDQNEYTWDTKSVPDGFYRVRIEASDEPNNPDALVQTSDALSAPLLVDNHPPEVLALAVDKGKLRGKAVDTLGPVSSLELSIDGLPFRPVLSRDGLFDTREESFEIELPTLSKGSHVLSVRATDAAQNIGSAELELH